jgi:transmembrane sensor
LNQLTVLIIKHLRNELTVEEAAELEAWAAAAPENRQLLQQLYDPAMVATCLHKMDSVNDQEAWQKISRFREVAQPPTTFRTLPVTGAPVSRFRRFVRSKMGVAAVVLVVLAAGWFTISYFSGSQQQQRVIVTHPGERHSLRLADGSQVILNGGSKLTLDKDFYTTNRHVHLEGEAYFDVAHIANPSAMPFIITTRTMDVKAVGTAFNIRAYADEKTDVTSLIRGKIIVTFHDTKAKNHQPAYVLLPLQKIVLHKEVRTGSTSTVAALQKGPHIDSLRTNQLTGGITETAWTENKLVFNAELLESVAGKIEKWYGIEVKIENPALANISCTGSFDTEPLDQVLETMQFSIPTLHYRKEENNKVLVLY